MLPGQDESYIPGGVFEAVCVCVVCVCVCSVCVCCVCVCAWMMIYSTPAATSGYLIPTLVITITCIYRVK